jgi:acetylglutamate synthase
MCEELKSIHSEAWEKTLLLEDGAERNVNKYIMQQTERFKERNEHRIKYSKVQNLLNSANQPLIEG